MYSDGMVAQKILVTEITRMREGMACVAGIDLSTHQMVRPLQSNGTNWEESKWVSSSKLQVGRVIEVQTASVTSGNHPHATEDLRISQVVYRDVVTDADLYKACKSTAHSNLDDLFSKNLVGGNYVVENTKCRSLGCLIVPVSKLRADLSYNKVKLVFDDHVGKRHFLPVTELQTANTPNTAKGAAALQVRLNLAKGPVALRLGLARAWAGTNGEHNPPRCYLQLNGIILPA